MPTHSPKPRAIPQIAGLTQSSLSLSLQFGPLEEPKLLRETLKRYWVRKVLGQALLDLVKPIELTVRVVDQEEARTLNQQYRQKDHATNVLTFSYEVEPMICADLVLCAPVIIREANSLSRELKPYMAHMLVHGALHAAGFDHETNEQEALEMEGMESLIMAKLGFEDPYLFR